MQSGFSDIIHVYSCRYDRQLDDGTYRRLLHMLPFEMHSKVLAFRRWEDAHGSLLGKLLLRAALEDSGYAGDLRKIRYSAEGRPGFEEGPDFNISHSGTMVTCIVGPSDRSRVGIDLEVERHIDIGDFRSQFSFQEWEMITGASNPQQMFYRFWTAKEAVIKADGRGLQLPLQEISVAGGTVTTIEKKHWFLRHCLIHPGYFCHIASERELGAPRMVERVPEDLLRNIPT